MHKCHFSHLNKQFQFFLILNELYIFMNNMSTTFISERLLTFIQAKYAFFSLVTQHYIRIYKLSFIVVEVIPQLKFCISNVWPKNFYQ